MVKEIVLKSIRLYQKTLSLDHGLFSFAKRSCGCRFYPSCSQYTYDAITRYGLWRGGYRGLRRILRCHPFSPGGLDPLE